MSFRFRITAWVVLSCTALILLMIFVAHRQLEEELRQGLKDRTHPGYPGWVIHNSYQEEEIEDILDELTRTWLWTAAPVIVLSLGAGLLLARRSLRPVHDINRQLDGMKADSLHGGIAIREADPVITDLASHLNSLLERAGTAYREMSEYSSQVAHELRTPLMLLRMRVEQSPPGTPPAFQEDLQHELARLSRFVERSLLAAKAEQGALVPLPEHLDLSDLVRDVTEDYGLLADERGLEMKLDLEESLWIDADSDLVRQTLHGLLENAVRYARSRIAVSCHAPDGRAVLEVRNDSDPATMATSGLGLGLRLVRGICQASGMQYDIRRGDRDFVATIHFSTELPSPQTHQHRSHEIKIR